MQRLIASLGTLVTVGVFGVSLAVSSTSPAAKAEGTAAGATSDTAAKLVQAGHYVADPEHTLVHWQLDHLGVTPYFGLFGNIDGTLDIDPADIAATKVDMTIPVADVTVASAGLEEHLLRAPSNEGGKPDFFGPDPANARFISTKVEQTGPDTASMTGDLTLNGVTKSVTMPVKFYGSRRMPAEMGGGLFIGFEAATTIQRSEFGLDLSLPMLGDAVELEIAAAFTPASK